MFVITIEGPDRVGKTTLAKHIDDLCYKLDLKSCILHPNKFQNNYVIPANTEDYLTAATKLVEKQYKYILKTKPDVLIYDRHLASLYAYWLLRAKQKSDQNQWDLFLFNVDQYYLKYHFFDSDFFIRFCPVLYYTDHLIDCVGAFDQLTTNYDVGVSCSGYEILHKNWPNADDYLQRFCVDKPFLGARYDGAVHKFKQYWEELEANLFLAEASIPKRSDCRKLLLNTWLTNKIYSSITYNITLKLKEAMNCI